MIPTFKHLEDRNHYSIPSVSDITPIEVRSTMAGESEIGSGAIDRTIYSLYSDEDSITDREETDEEALDDLEIEVLVGDQEYDIEF